MVATIFGFTVLFTYVVELFSRCVSSVHMFVRVFIQLYRQ